MRPGDDTSCLNLYQPKNPRIVAATQDFINSGRFAFHSSLAETPEERANPWLLLNREFGDGAVPVIADANSMTYVLHMKLGDEFVLPGSSERPIRLRLVAALSDSIFQGELLMAEQPFVRLFPEWEGYRFFLADAPLGQTGEVTELLESRLSDFGVDVASTAERLAGFHRVEYTYLSTFQMLGGLGLVLGTLGLGAILLRNVLERRRELALLRALGYTRSGFLDDGRGRERVAAGRRVDRRHVLRAGRDCAGVSRSRRPIAGRDAGAAAARRVWGPDCWRRSARRPRPCDRRCCRRYARNRSTRLIDAIPVTSASARTVVRTTMNTSHRLIVGTLLLAGFTAVVAAQNAGSDWPQWRGPRRDGTLTAFTEPKAWPDTLTQRWKITVGEGYSTPILVGNRVYQFSRQGENEVMRAIDAATGKVVWERATRRRSR